MKRLLLLPILILAAASALPLWGQSGTTLVTAQVQDSANKLYSNCQWSVVFVGENTIPGVGPYSPAPLLNGQQGTCDSFGRFSVNLADNINTVQPTPSQWAFSICSTTGYLGGPFCVTNVLVTIAGAAQDLTTTFQPLMPLLPTPVGPGGGGLGDPGAPGLVDRTTFNVTVPATAASVIALFSGCSGSLYLGADGVCHTSAAPTGVANGSALVSSGISNPPVYQTKPQINPLDLGIDCSGAVDATALWNSGIPGGSSVLLPQGCLLKFSSNITIPQNVTVQFSQGATFAPDAAVTVNMNGSVVAGNQQRIVNITNGTVSFNRVAGVSVGWYGAVGDGVTDDFAAIQAAITANQGRKITFAKTQPFGTGGGGAVNCDYYSSQTVSLQHGNGTWLEGNVAQSWSGAPMICNPVNTIGIVVPADCYGCRISHMAFTGPQSPYPAQCWQPSNPTTAGNFGKWDGIDWYGGEPIIDDVYVACYNGNGLYINGYNPTWQPSPGPGTPGQPDLGEIHGFVGANNRGNCIAVEGGDSSARSNLGINCRQNERWGILENSPFGSVYDNPHTNSNGNDAGIASGGNGRKIESIFRTSNVVTACPFTDVSGFSVGQKLFIVDSLDSTGGTGFNTTTTPVTITAVVPSANCTDTAATITAFTIASNVVTFTATNTFLAGMPVAITGTGFPAVDGKTLSVLTTGLSGSQFTASLSAANSGPNSGLSGAATPTFSTIAPGYIQWSQTGAHDFGYLNGGYIGIGYPISTISRTSNVVTVATASTPVNDAFLTLGGFVTLVGTSIDGTYNITTAPNGNASPWSFPLIGSNFSASAGWLFSSNTTDIASISTRTVTDAAIASGTNTLFAQDAQFSSTNIGQSINVAGAGSGGATLTTTITGLTNTTTVKLAANASTTVTSGEADFGGAWDGGPYKGMTNAANSVWLNPYWESNQPNAEFNSNQIIIGTNNAGGINFAYGIPQMMTVGKLTTGTGYWWNSPVDQPAVWQLGAGSTTAQNQTLRFLNSSATTQGTIATTDPNGGMTLLNGLISYNPGNAASIVSINGNITSNASSANPPITFNRGNAVSPFSFFGTCAGNAPTTGSPVVLFDETTGSPTFTNPCPATGGSGNFNGPTLTWTSQYWNGTSAHTDSWLLQPVLGAGSSPTSTLTLTHSGGSGGTSVPSVDFSAIPNIKFAALSATSIKDTGITGLTQCVHVDTTGAMSGTGSDCGAGAGGGTVTHTLGALAVNVGAVGNGSADIETVDQMTNKYVDYPTSTAPANPSAGFERLYWNSSTNVMSCLTSGGGNCLPTGTVSSVGLTQSGSVFTITGSPITTSGSLNLAFASQSSNLFLASPIGSSGVPVFRGISGADIPATNLAISTNGGVSGNLPPTNLNSGTSASSTTFWRGDGTWATPAGSGSTNNATQYSGPYYSGAGTSNVISGIAAPTSPNGVPQTWTSTPSGSAATAPAWLLPGISGRAVTGSTSTDTITSSDCSNRVEYTGSVAVAIALPTPTTLAVPACAFRMVNRLSTLNDLTITSATLTCNGASTCVLHQGQLATLYVDPTGSNWQADIQEQSQGAGANITFARSATGVSIAGNAGTVTSVSTGNFSPLFTAAFATGTTTPALSFTASTFAANQLFGNPTGSTAAPIAFGIAAPLAFASSALHCDTCVTSAAPLAASDLVAGSGGAQGTASATAHNVAIPLVCADTTGTGTAGVCSTSPTFTIAANDCITYTTTTANTGALTWAVNGGSAAAVQKWQGTAMVANDILANHPYPACFDGTHWQVTTIGNAPASGGTVTSVGLTVNATSPSGIFTVTGSPVTTSGTLNFNLAGTSGGHPYFSSSTVLSSSGAGTTHGVWLAQGAGNADTSTGVGATNTVLHGNTGADPSFSAVVAADITNNTITGTQLASSLALVTPNIGAATGTSLLATGIVDGKAPITITTGTTATLGAATYQSGYTFNQEATAGTGVTYTLPATAAGLQYCVRNSIVSGTGAADTGVLTVYPPASSFVILNGVRNTVGGGGTHGVASGGAAGDSACFVAIDATDWEVFVQRGTWTAN